jgi:hypothetical protein
MPFQDGSTAWIYCHVVNEPDITTLLHRHPQLSIRHSVLVSELISELSDYFMHNCHAHVHTSPFAYLPDIILNENNTSICRAFHYCYQWQRPLDNK